MDEQGDDPVLRQMHPVAINRKTARAALLAVGVLAAPLAAQVSPAARDTARRATPDTGARVAGADTVRRVAANAAAVTPQPDQARGVDAEIRVALFELVNDRYVPALSRLQWLNASPTALTASGAPGALRGREDMLFLLAEAYYRLGLDASFRSTAEQLLGSGGRYATVLQAQMLLAAYRQGDYADALARAKTLGQSGAPAEVRGLASLVAGLAAYQTRDFAGARAAFAAAQQAGAPYADYAAYMDALAMLRQDTVQTAPALQALQALADRATGEFGDQVRLTAAQLAYEAGQFDQAASIAGRITPTSGLAAQGLFTRAWALYKGNQVDAAGDAFAEFARRYPQLPERDEARLMSAQVLLQQGSTADAAAIFRAVADSAAGEVNALQGRSRDAMSAAARALVQARAAGLLFLTDPASGKTIALQDAAGADASTLAAAFADTAAPAPRVSAPEVVSLEDVMRRVSELGPAVGGSFPSRVLFTQVSATQNRATYGERSQALYEADVAVALARHRLDEQLLSNQRQVALLRSLLQGLGSSRDTLQGLAGRLTAAEDSLRRVAVALDAAGARIRQMFLAQVSTTRLLAEENERMIDSVRSTLGASAGPLDQTVLSTEGSTATLYRQTADLIAGGIDSAIARHPVFARRDSVRRRGEQIAQLLGATQSALTAVMQRITDELAKLEVADPENVRGLRAALSAAEARRAAAETRLVALVDAELSARAGELVASLRRDTEAAQFGSASASFFQALDAAGRGATGAPSGTGGPSAAPAAGTPAVPQSQK